MEEEIRLTAELQEDEDEDECSSLESSLTEMDWLSQLNVGGVLANISNGQGDGGSLERSIDLNLDDIGDIKTGESYSNSRDSSSLSKPPYSYTHLITAAINSSSTKKMTLSEIYQWIAANYPYYQSAGYGWKNSIRHNLSLNKHFVKQSRMKDDPGKGSYWALCEQPLNSQNSIKLPQRRSHKQKFVQRQLQIDQVKTNGCNTLESPVFTLQTTENPLKFVPAETVDLSGLTEADLIEAIRTICKNQPEIFTDDPEGTLNALTLKNYVQKFCQEDLGEPQQYVENTSFDVGNVFEHQSIVEIFSMLSQCVNNNNNTVNDSIGTGDDVTSNGFLMQTDPTSNPCKNLDTLLYQPQIPMYGNVAVVSEAGPSSMSTPEEAYLLCSNNIQENFLQSGDFMSVMQQIDTSQSQSFQQLEPSNFECDGANIIPSFTQMIEGIDLDNIWDPAEDIV